MPGPSVVSELSELDVRMGEGFEYVLQVKSNEYNKEENRKA